MHSFYWGVSWSAVNGRKGNEATQPEPWPMHIYAVNVLGWQPHLPTIMYKLTSLADLYAQSEKVRLQADG